MLLFLFCLVFLPATIMPTGFLTFLSFLTTTVNSVCIMYCGGGYFHHDVTVVSMAIIIIKPWQFPAVCLRQYT